MSIIFQKLENLKDKSSDYEDLHGSKLQQGQNIYTFRKLIFSPRGAFHIFAIIAAFTLISFYALSFLKDSLDSGSNKAIVINRHQSNQMPANDMPPHDIDSTDQSPGIDPATQPVVIPGSPPGIEPAAGTPAPSRESKKFNVPEYFISQTKQDSSGRSTDPDLKDARDNIKFLPSLNRSDTPAKQIKTFDHLSPKTFVNNSSKPAVKSNSQTGIDKIQVKNRTTTENITIEDKPKPASLEGKKVIKQASIRLAKQKRTKKISTIATLVTDLEDAFEKNDDDRIDQLLARLGRIKGENNLYYLKLTAFREIERKNYDLAERLLNRVLAKNKTDFEAGINMAIIEISQKKFTNAKQRLIRLKELYPSRGSVDDLLKLL